MRVAWLADAGNEDGTIGGAEMTAAEFRLRAPAGVKVVPVGPHELEQLGKCDAACVFNCVSYPYDTAEALEGKRVVRYWNDVAPHGSPELTQWLLAHAANVFTSPLHKQRFPWLNGKPIEYHLVPPPVDLRPFQTAAKGSGDRGGAVAVGPWMNPGKAPHRAAEWADQQQIQLHFYGGGPFAPPGSVPVAYGAMPQLLAKYQTFVHLPAVLEPFGRTVVEAWAAGCQIVVNRLVGARWWIEERPAQLESAVEDYWQLVRNGG